jgi:hopene-associated glycosyltransferase HpnB
MHELATVAAALAFLIWVYLAFARGLFWHFESTHENAAHVAHFPAGVAAIVPARNEARSIGPAITSLLNQSVPMTIFLVDDESTDGTGDLARRIAESASSANALVVMEGRPLPSDWTGKLWAMQQGFERALSANPEWLLFTDADVVHDAQTAANLRSIAAQGGYDLVSFMVKLHCESFAEKLLIPAFVYFFFMLYPPAWIRDPRRVTAGAAGGCMLVRTKALMRAGGLGPIRGAMIDDCSLARLLKQQGGRLWLGLTDRSRSLRRYETFPEIERMVSRTAFNQLKHSVLLLMGTILGMMVVYSAPPLLLFSRNTGAIFMSVAAWALTTVTYSRMVRHYRLNPAWALSLPLAALFYMGATIHSAVKYWSGRGGEWKGRTQDIHDRQRRENVSG